MARAKFKTYDEALEAQVDGKQKVRDAKQALTSYLKTNKLKRNVDYSKDDKHNTKLTKLNNAVERASNVLVRINEQVKALKPKKERVSKYDYPDGLTADEKKKFRQKARAAANKGTKNTKKKDSAKKSKKKSKKRTSKKRSRK